MTDRQPPTPRVLRSLRATAERGSSEGGSALAGGNAFLDDTGGMGEFASELGAVSAYFKARIAAARQSLSPGAVAAAVRALRSEKSIAMRAVIDRWQVHFQNTKQKPVPDRPSSAQPLLRYPGLRNT
jgi:hypothetical protein